MTLRIEAMRAGSRVIVSPYTSRGSTMSSLAVITPHRAESHRAEASRGAADFEPRGW